MDSQQSYFMEPIEITIPLMASCVIAVISNVFVCYLIVTKERLKTVTNMFVFSLCLCDILFAGVLVPAHCFFQQTLAYQFLVIITVLIYIGNLTSATFERFFSITKPFKYHQHMTKKRAIQITFAAWVIPSSYCLLPLFWQSDTTVLPHKIYLICTLILFLLGPLLFIVFVYIKIFIEIKKMVSYERTLHVTIRKRENSGANEQWLSFCCFKYHVYSKSPNETATLSDTFSLDLNPDFDVKGKTDHVGTARHYNRCISYPYSDRFRPNILSESDLVIEEDSDENLEIDDSLDNGNLKEPFNQRSPKSRSVTRFSNPNNKSNFQSRATNKSIFSSGFQPKRLSILSQNLKIKPKVTGMKNRIMEFKASLTFGIVAFTYMFTWLPVVIMTFLDALDKQQHITRNMQVFSIFAIAVNALSDPFLYGLLLQPFRMTIKKVFRKLLTLK